MAIFRASIGMTIRANESVETGYEIKVGDLADGQYTVTVTKK